MSSIDIGKIKFTWRGNYDVATTYEAEDIVYSSGSTWICVATSPVTGSAPSPSNPDWNKMAQGSDLGSLIGLSAGDIIFFDGNDFQRVPAGSQGQYLRWGANGLEWGVPMKTHTHNWNTQTTFLASAWGDATGSQFSFTPISATSTITLVAKYQVYMTPYGISTRVLWSSDNTNWSVLGSDDPASNYENYDTSSNNRGHSVKLGRIQHGGASTIYIKSQGWSHSGNGAYINESTNYWSSYLIWDVEE